MCVLGSPYSVSAVLLLDASYVSPRGFPVYRRLQDEWLVPSAGEGPQPGSTLGASGVYHDDAYTVPSSEGARVAQEGVLKTCKLHFSHADSTGAIGYLQAVESGAVQCGWQSQLKPHFLSHRGLRSWGSSHRASVGPSHTSIA